MAAIESMKETKASRDISTGDSEIKVVKDSLNTFILHSEKKYRSLDEFIDFVHLTGDTHGIMGILMNKVSKAREKISTRSPDASFLDNYHIALRHGEYHAQVDKALSEIQKFFMGYGPEVDIIQEGNDFYVASRTIRHFVHDFTGYRLTPEGIFKDSSIPGETLLSRKDMVHVG